MADLKGLKVAVLATDGFEESELTEPMKALQQAGATVTIVSLKPGEIQGFKHHEKSVRIAVDAALSTVKPDQFDAVVLPGGTLNADALRSVPEVQQFLKAMSAKPMAVICHAPWELVSAGLAKGRTMTAYHTIQDDVRNAGARFEDQEVVVDGNLITSRQPSDLPAFNREMLRVFGQSRR